METLENEADKHDTRAEYLIRWLMKMSISNRTGDVRVLVRCGFVCVEWQSGDDGNGGRQRI